MVGRSPTSNQYHHVLMEIAVQELNAQSQVFSGLTTYITLADLHNPANYTEFYFSILRYGYGYGFRGILIYIAVAVLLIHVALALAHVAIVVASGLSSDAWSTMGEMMVLHCRATSQYMCWCE
jgi:hypothetical protein